MRWADLLVGLGIGYTGSALGLWLSATVDKAPINWFLLPFGTILGAYLYYKEAGDAENS